MISNKKDIMVRCYGERIHVQELNESGSTEFKHGSQLLFGLRKFLLPGFPYGRVPHEVILTIETTNEINGRAGTVSEKQAVKERYWSVQELQTDEYK